MATLQVSSRESFSSYGLTGPTTIAAKIKVPKIQVSQTSTPKHPSRSRLVAELDYNDKYTKHVAKNYMKDNSYYSGNTKNFRSSNPIEISKVRLIVEIISDRIEMHRNVGAQRDNWNHLLLASINMITLSAATMAAIAAMGITASQASLAALKVSSTVLYTAATAMLVIMNTLQPSQLAEEQRNAARLFKQLLEELRTRIYLGKDTFTVNDFNEAMEKVLALDRAYPLPLLGAMLEKFPKTVEPSVWWPERKNNQNHQTLELDLGGNNGWDENLEEEMKEISRVIQKKDMAEYLRLSKRVLHLNNILGISGPLLTGIAAFGSAFVDCVNLGSWPVMVGVVGGALASVVNTIEHGVEAGMVFEMYRNMAGFFKLMQEDIEGNLFERDKERRENGEVFEMKIALQLGRSVSELRQLAVLSSSDHEEKACEEFASKLF